MKYHLSSLLSIGFLVAQALYGAELENKTLDIEVLGRPAVRQTQTAKDDQMVRLIARPSTSKAMEQRPVRPKKAEFSMKPKMAREHEPMKSMDSSVANHASTPKVAIGGIYTIALFPELSMSEQKNKTWNINVTSLGVHQDSKAIKGNSLYRAEGWTLRQNVAVTYQTERFSIQASTAYVQHQEDVVLSQSSTGLSHFKVGKIDHGITDTQISFNYLLSQPYVPQVGLTVSMPTGSKESLLGTGSSSQAVHLTWTRQKFKAMMGWIQQNDLATRLGELELKPSLFAHLAYHTKKENLGSPSFGLYLSQNPFRDELEGEDASDVLAQLSVHFDLSKKNLHVLPQLTLGFDDHSSNFSFGLGLSF